ncbi:alkaline phosphatase family protein [Pseudahrensia aquimaris]|uniref:Alkaline phosphatase family protein n=1 Tax=Pseudahrensia aquimaris TaxID=744461 RepID=A0ABW3F9G4_9HYPH
MQSKLLLIILDGVPYRNWRRYFGNLEGWVKNGDAQVTSMRASLPSMSGPCYASIHTGVPPQEHGILLNDVRFRLEQPDIFSCVADVGGKSGAVAHSYWSEFFNRYPFDPVFDLEYDEPEGPIHHGRFHSMSGYGHDNQMTPSDTDLFGTLTMLCARHSIDYGLLHTCTLDSMGHRFGHDNVHMDNACAIMDAQLSVFLPKWLDMGYEVIVTADHGQSDRGHHGGVGEDQTDFALYYFGKGELIRSQDPLDQLQLAPSILSRLGAKIPNTMKSSNFFK